ncbi:MAG: hypothetical protein LBR22_10040 [Desulfovibrio sp.]|jgi:cell fate regulator YaaT (PSP1 superfamily)|nr:hypothetical protein [Desulfovibrio sp.]
MPLFGLRLRPLAQTIYCLGPEDLRPGENVIVEDEQGLVYSTVDVGPLEQVPGVDPETAPAVLRRAEEGDGVRHRENWDLAQRAAEFCRWSIAQRRLDMKLVDVEVFFDRSKMVFYFTAPSRIDFRDLVKDLVREYHVRIELRQIGVRHETQMVGAVGNCGMVCCCNRYLRRFAPVTIRMAKEQNLFLNPAKISGICGRLLCCLAYEQENYERFFGQCPKLGKRYQTSTMGPVKVLRANMFRNAVTVVPDGGGEEDAKELSLEEWEALEPQRIDQSRSSEHPDGADGEDGQDVPYPLDATEEFPSFPLEDVPGEDGGGMAPEPAPSPRPIPSPRPVPPPQVRGESRPASPRQTPWHRGGRGAPGAGTPASGTPQSPGPSQRHRPVPPGGNAPTGPGAGTDGGAPAPSTRPQQQQYDPKRGRRKRRPPS